METTWGPSGGYGDNVGMMGTTRRTWGGDHGDHRSWRPHGDLLGAMGMTRGQCGDDREDMGTTGTTWGGDQRQRRPQVMETTWGPSGGYGDNVGTMGMTQGQRGDDGDVGTTGTTKSLKMP